MACLQTIKNLLFFHLICIEGCDINVTQSPSEISIDRGSSALLTCQWNSSCEVQRIRISWFKDRKKINSTIQTTKNISSLHRGKTYFKIHNTGVNETGVYWCNVIVEIPLPMQNGTGPGTTLKFNANKTNEDWKSAWTVPIAAALAGAAILVILFTGYRCLRRTCWHGGSDIPVYVNNKVPPKSLKDHSTKTAEEIKTASDFSSNKDFQVNPTELVETRNKMKKQKAHFFHGNAQLKRKTEGQFKKKRSLHIYINSRELKKHCKQTTDASDNNKYKAQRSHKALQKQNRMKGMPEDVFQTVVC
ncbi:uncharacterized protein LOC121325573 [Polyodon spathula]|uniref:uncharacterized protein LOC121325573 n=1 Tax=Polyodon spathula TaxID=7913 RepID=UPI001B7E40A3|nr:uncharacterized protein LOC121325573 [Polyodon spathula]